MTATQATTRRSAGIRIPVGILVAAALLAAQGFLQRPHGGGNDIVARAIAAPYADVGIAPVERSVEFWQQRADANPSDYLSRTQLAGAVMGLAKERGDLSLYPRAEAAAKAALALNPTDDGALLALGAARAANHDFATSIELAQRVLARNPSSKAARVAVADGNFELGNYALAARELDALLPTLPVGTGTESRLAKRAAVEGRLDDAVRESAAAVVAAGELDLRASDAAFYRFQLGHFLAQAGRRGEALAVLDAGLVIDPDHLPSLEAKAKVLVSLNRLEEARALYERLVARTPAADLYGELAKVDRALGRDAEARRLVATGLRIGHDQLRTYPAERRHLAAFFAEVEPATALEAAKADFATRHDVGAYDALGWAYYRNGRVEEAAAHVDGALAQGTRDATLLAHAGMIELAAGHRARAHQLLRDALALDPQFDLVQAPLARAALQRSGRA